MLGLQPEENGDPADLGPHQPDEWVDERENSVLNAESARRESLHRGIAAQHREEVGRWPT